MMIGLGVLAVAGIGLYMWKRRKDGESTEKTETKSNARGLATSLKSKTVLPQTQNTLSGCNPDEHICGMHTLASGSNYIKCCKTSKDGSSVFSHLGAAL